MTVQPPRSLGLLLADAARLLRRRLEQESRDIAMTSAQLQIVVRLSKNEGIGQAGLAAIMDLEPMTLCRHVDRMVAAGLVERRPDPRDRRARRLYTTEKSRALIEPMRGRAQTVYEQVMTGLAEDERETLFHALETILGNLAGEAGERPCRRRSEEAVSEAPVPGPELVR